MSYHADFADAEIGYQLERFARNLDSAYTDQWSGDGYDPEQLARILAAVRDCRADLAEFAKRVETDYVNDAPKRLTIEGLGEVEIKRSTRRTAWQMDDLGPAIISRLVDEPETLYDPQSGELLPYAVIGLNIWRRLRACVGIGYGKVTGLRELGIDPDEYAQVHEDGYSVQLPRREIV